MRNQYVPYELALKLKEKGFNEPCMGAWVQKDGMEWLYYSGFPLGSLKAPLWQQVLDWLDAKDKAVNPHPVIYTSEDAISGWTPTINNAVFNHRLKFKTRTEALKSGIEKALELI